MSPSSKEPVLTKCIRTSPAASSAVSWSTVVSTTSLWPPASSRPSPAQIRAYFNPEPGARADRAAAPRTVVAEGVDRRRRGAVLDGLHVAAPGRVHDDVRDDGGLGTQGLEGCEALGGVHGSLFQSWIWPATSCGPARPAARRSPCERADERQLVARCLGGCPLAAASNKIRGQSRRDWFESDPAECLVHDRTKRS